MSGSIFGEYVKLATFGESHGKMIGGVLDGFPAGIDIDIELIENEMKRRCPNQSGFSTDRSEPDKFEIVSGVFNGKSTGAPIAFFIENKDVRAEDYDELKDVFRPSHADYTYYQKYGIKGISGGGRSSARETACRVLAGAIAKCFLKSYNISVKAFTSGIGNIDLDKDYKELDLSNSDNNAVRCPDTQVAKAMEDLLLKTKEEGDSLGGRISCVIRGVMPGLGEPVFDKFHAVFAKAMLSIPAAKGFEIGSGFHGSYMKGSQHNDEFFVDDNKMVSTKTNFSGGVQGGISNGNDIYFRLAFKPVSSIRKKQNTINLAGESKEIEIGGRHDICVVPRAVAVVEAMAWLVIADFLIASKAHNSLKNNK